jgi:hypothetical protein
MFFVMILVTSFRFSFSWSSWLEGPGVPPPCVSVRESRYSRVVLEMNVSVPHQRLRGPQFDHLPKPMNA